MVPSCLCRDWIQKLRDSQVSSAVSSPSKAENPHREEEYSKLTLRILQYIGLFICIYIYIYLSCI